jgi:hypothetical protein
VLRNKLFLEKSEMQGVLNRGDTFFYCEKNCKYKKGLVNAHPAHTETSSAAIWCALHGNIIYVEYKSRSIFFETKVIVPKWSGFCPVGSTGASATESFSSTVGSFAVSLCQLQKEIS